jgi:hypothetical protein
MNFLKKIVTGKFFDMYGVALVGSPITPSYKVLPYFEWARVTSSQATGLPTGMM